MTYIPYLSTIVTFAFVVAVFNRYLQHDGVHLLLWAIGLFFYGIGTLSETLLSQVYNIFILKLWYIAGAMLTAAWLGMGTVHLLIRKGNAAQMITYALTAVSLLACALVFMAPEKSAIYNIAVPASEQYKDMFVRSGFILVLTILLNIYGTLTLVGGAIYSAFLFWRKKILANRMFGNILIAAGALSPAMGGTLLKAGFADMLYLSEFLGALLMFVGFLMATSSKPETAE